MSDNNIYMSWVGFRPDGRISRYWTKVHIKKDDSRFLCGIKIPTDIFDMSRKPTANLLCAKCEDIAHAQGIIKSKS